MNTPIIEAYSYYKNLYPEAIVLFRFDSCLKALFDDAETISRSLNLTSCNEVDGCSVVEIPIDSRFDAISQLGQLGYKVHTVACRNESGKLNWPDIHLLIEEKSTDY